MQFVLDLISCAKIHHFYQDWRCHGRRKLDNENVILLLMPKKKRVKVDDSGFSAVRNCGGDEGSSKNCERLRPCTMTVTCCCRRRNLPSSNCNEIEVEKV